MMYKALKSFAGKVNMKRGEVKDIEDKDIAKDLVDSKYIEPVKDQAKTKGKKEEV